VVPGQFEIALDSATQARLAGRSGPVTLGVRSEDVQLSAADGAFAQGSGRVAQASGGVAQVSDGVVARVYGVENHGVEKIVALRVAEHTIKATVPARTAVQVDGQAVFGFNQRKLQFFERASGANLFFGEERKNG